MPILRTTVPSSSVNLVEALARASALSGTSAFSVAVELLSAMIGPPRMGMAEYFVQGAWIGPASPATALSAIVPTGA